MRCEAPYLALNLFKTTVPFWGQITCNLGGLFTKKDCGCKRIDPTISIYTLHLPSFFTSSWASAWTTIADHNTVFRAGINCKQELAR